MEKTKAQIKNLIFQMRQHEIKAKQLGLEIDLLEDQLRFAVCAPFEFGYDPQLDAWKKGEETWKPSEQ
jgi:hypothetical protein